MSPPSRKVLVALLITLGALQLAIVGSVTLQSCALERQTRGHHSEEEQALGTISRAVRTRRAAQEGRPIGHLEITRLGLKAPLVEGISRGALLHGTGHVPGTAFPGEPGNAALAGHRDTHLAKLRHVQAGDEIRIDTPDGIFVYVVDSAFVVPPNRGDLLHRTERPTLTLVTCYPFRWIGPAPDRFIVQAHPASRGHLVHSAAWN